MKRRYLQRNQRQKFRRSQWFSMSEAQDISIKHASAWAKEMTEVVFLPRLKKIVSETPNPYDDVVLGALEPVIRDALAKDFLKKLVPPKVG